MTRLSRAKTTLFVVCVLFFLLGTGSALCMAPFLPLESWQTKSAMQSDLNWARILGLTEEQLKKQESLLREENAALDMVELEIKRTYYPRLKAIRQQTVDRLRLEVLNPEQRKLFDDYSTGRISLPDHGGK